MTEVATQGCITISEFTNESIIRSTYNGVMQGVSRTNEALTFLQRIDLEKIGLDEKYIEETPGATAFPPWMVLYERTGLFRWLCRFTKVTIMACVPRHSKRVKPSTL